MISLINYCSDGSWCVGFSALCVHFLSLWLSSGCSASSVVNRGGITRLFSVSPSVELGTEFSCEEATPGARRGRSEFSPQSSHLHSLSKSSGWLSNTGEKRGRGF